MFLENLNSPFGMALVGNDFYVANTDAVVRFPYTPGQTRIEGAGTKVVDLPGRTAQPPLDQEPDRQPRRQQALRHGRLEQQRRRERHGRRGRPRGDLGDRPRDRQAAASSPSGIRNPERHGLEHGPGGAPVLWTVVNERDEIGSDLVPDYLTSVRDGGFYGWPYSYYGQHVDDAGAAAEPGAGRQGDRARLRPRPAHRLARPGLVGRRAPAGDRSRAASSSASTARGTAGRTAATR